MRQLKQTSLVTTVNHKSIIVAAAAILVVGAPEWISAATQPWEVLGELARSLLIACVLARLVARARVADWKGALALGAGVCVFQAAILLGSVLHEQMPLTAYAIQGGYALVSTLGAAAILGAWGKGRVPDAIEKAAPNTNPSASPTTRPGVNYKAVILAAVAAIVVGGLWYSPFLFGGAWAQLKANASVAGAKLPPAEVVGEFVRSGIVAYVLARFVVALRVVGTKGAALLGGAMWLGFHATLILYSVIHQHMPLTLYAIHAGHGLANDLAIGAIVGAWRLKARALN
jgi:uncharacterized protein DUF1761